MLCVLHYTCLISPQQSQFTEKGCFKARYTARYYIEPQVFCQSKLCLTISGNKDLDDIIVILVKYQWGSYSVLHTCGSTKKIITYIYEKLNLVKQVFQQCLKPNPCTYIIVIHVYQT